MSVASSNPIIIDGDPKHFPIGALTTPGVEQVLFSEQVPVSTSRDIWQLVTSCAFEGVFKIFVDSNLIGSGRTGPGRGVVIFPWFPQQNAKAGQTILVTFESRENSPIVAIEAYLMCADVLTA